MIGSKLGHYEISRKLGSGGMGDVYAARDGKLGREVALKVLPPELADDDERRQRFEREARTAAALNHPNIVTLFAVEEADDECFITMELVQGKPLAEQIPEGGMEATGLLEIAVALADAVATAHEAGIIHRDLKPANVMITTDGVVKVLDFGLAKVAPADEPPPSQEMATQTAAAITTGEGRILGTPAYMSPEQAEGKKLDLRTDIFSLGVVLYEMATGQRPFEGDSAMSTISSVLKDAPSPIAELRAELPPRLGRIIGRCLLKDRRRRYQTARDLATDLEELASDGAVASSQSVVGHTVPTPPTTRKLPKALVAVCALAIAAGAGALGHALATRNGAPAAAASTAGSGTAATAGPRVKRFRRLTTEYGLELGPHLSPDGKWFVYAAGEPSNLDVYRQRVGGSKRTNLTEACRSDDSQPAISPDGERVAFRSERDGGGLYVMGATGESVRRITDFGYHPAWSPDGKHLVVSSLLVLNPRSRGSNCEAWEIEVESGTKRRLESLIDAVHGSYSPSGRWLAFDGIIDEGGRGASKRLLYATAREGGETHALHEGGLDTVWTPVWAGDGKSIYFSTLTSGTMNISRIGVDEATGQPSTAPQSVTAGVSVSASWPSLSSDGQRLLFSVSSTTGNIAKVRFDAKKGQVVGEPIMLTRGANGFAAPDVSADGEWITFCSSWIRPSTPERIYVARPDGTGLVALTSDQDKAARLPRWSGDSKTVLFYSNRSGDWAHWRVAQDGSGLRKITDTPGETLIFGIPQRNGTRVAGWTNERGQLLYDLDRPFASQEIERISRYPASGPQFVPLDWSPDATALVGYTIGGADERVLTYSLETKQYDEIAAGWCPRWLRDGRRLVYSDIKGLRLVDVDTKESKPLLSVAPDQIHGHIGISPDERWIYFSLVTEDGDVWMAELE